jgi:acetate kinase
MTALGGHEDAILTINAGSSSLKFALYSEGSGDNGLRALLHGQIEGIGEAPHLIIRAPDGAILSELRWPADADHDYDHLIDSLLRDLEDRLKDRAVRMVGHRVVHGGTRHCAPVLVDAAVLAELESLTPLAPLHQDHNLAPIRALRRLRADVPQLACFDTAFHQTMPPVATRMAVPRALHDAGVRRYGFHGLSYEFIARHLRRVDPVLSQGRLVIAHLGGGASLCALASGRSVDTTMGLTGLDGLVMGTRSGAIDPGALLYLLQEKGMTPKALEDLLYRRSGLLGVSGISADMRALLASDDPHAAETVDLFVHRAAQAIAAMATSLGGIDGLVFTAGIGEHSPEIRARIAARLGWLGARIDEVANRAGDFVISAPDSRIALRVMATDEEAMIAIHCQEQLAETSST